MKKILFTLLFFMTSAITFAQTTYTDCKTFFKDGATVYTFINDKLTLYVKGYEAKNGYNAKEFFVEITIQPKVDMINIDPSKATAYIDVKDKQKPIDFYTYESYIKKLNRNALLWGSNAKTAEVSEETKTKVTSGGYSADINSETTGTIVTKSATEVYKEEKANNKKWVSTHYLRKNTLEKDKMFGGVIASKRPSQYPVHFSIEINGDTYKVDIEKTEE